MNWQERAADLAARVAPAGSRWRPAVASVPRHLLIPRWFERRPDTWDWQARDGEADPGQWLDAAYGNRSVVTRVGALHADHAGPGQVIQAWPTSSATKPSLVVGMYRLAWLGDGVDVLDVGTGSGYGCALLAAILGPDHVTSIDVDPYVTQTAAERLDRIGTCPPIVTADASAPLPGSYDRIVPMVSLPSVPASWLAALRPGGRLVFSLSGGYAVITATKMPDGGAEGQIEHYPASFMTARHGQEYTHPHDGTLDLIRQADGEHVSHSRYPVVDPSYGAELDTILSITLPGIMYDFQRDEQTGVATAWMIHPDGSWARASGKEGEPATVHQSGPRRLWDALDQIRYDWITSGWLPTRGAKARIDPDGTCYLSHGRWQATIDPVR